MSNASAVVQPLYATPTPTRPGRPASPNTSAQASKARRNGSGGGALITAATSERPAPPSRNRTTLSTGARVNSDRNASPIRLPPGSMPATRCGRGSPATRIGLNGERVTTSAVSGVCVRYRRGCGSPHIPWRHVRGHPAGRSPGCAFPSTPSGRNQQGGAALLCDLCPISRSQQTGRRRDGSGICGDADIRTAITMANCEATGST